MPANAALIATNITRADGSVSLLNATTVLLFISNIHGLALTNPTSPGYNMVGTGRNHGPMNCYEYIRPLNHVVRHKTGLFDQI